MKTINFTKSNADKCRRRIVVSQIIKLQSLGENERRHEKIVREVAKLHALWFQGISKDMRIAGLQADWQTRLENSSVAADFTL